jgi:hypothetical protein
MPQLRTKIRRDICVIFHNVKLLESVSVLLARKKYVKKNIKHHDFAEVFFNLFLKL